MKEYNFSELHRTLVFHLIFDVIFLERELLYSMILLYSRLMLSLIMNVKFVDVF